MSALAEALVAAQRRALTALQKAYVAGTIDKVELSRKLSMIGATDMVESTFLLEALDVIRETGVSLPAETPPAANGTPAEKKSEPASDAQLAFIAKLVKDKQATPPDTPLTKAEAHEIIDTLQAGTYDAAKWTVPF